MIDDQDLKDALDRLARTADGRLLYLYCQKEVCSFRAADDDGALRQHEGRRRFAAELMGHMSQGIAESDRTAITFASHPASRTDTRPRGAARRVTLDTPVPGWDTDASGRRDAP